MSQKFLSSVALTGISNGSILKVNSSGEIVAAVDGTDYNTGSSQWTTTGNDIYYNTGNVGIGETSPDGLLHIKGSAQATEFYIESSTGTASTSGAIKIAQNNRSAEGLAGEMVFYVQDNNVGGTFWREAMAIINSGNIGIGNSSPGNNRLKVTGATDITGTLTLSGYTAGLLKTDSSGTVSLDTNTYLTTSTASTTYLPLTGGTVANGNNASPLTIGRTSASALQVGVKFSANDGESAPSEVYFGMGTDGNPYWASTANLTAGSEIWHAGNDGASSGLDADLLDGNHASAFASSATYQTFGTGSRGWMMPDYGGNTSNFLRMYYEDGANALRLYSYHGTTTGLANLELYDGSAYATITATKIGNWDTAYGWGNHASAGYITSLSGYATTTYVDTAVSNLVNSAPTALDTLNELAAALGNDASFSTTVSTALGNRLRLDSAVDYTAAEKSNGRSNLGLGSAATSATTDFAAASHNHDSRYYTETEVDTLLTGKASTETATTSKNGLMSSADKTKLDGIANGAEVNVQADWNQTTTTADDYIKNKPTLGTAAAAASTDFVAASGDTMSGDLNMNGNDILSIRSLTLSNREKSNIEYAYQLLADANDSDAPATLGTYTSSYPEGLYFRDNSNTHTYTLYHTGHFSGTHIANWQTAYGWGDHAGLYATASHTHTNADSTTDGFLSSGDYDKFVTAFGWGDHDGLYLPIGGGTMSGTMKVTGSIIHEFNSGGGYIPFPKGGYYVTTTGSHTGAIKITLPVHGTDDMLKFVVDIFDYSTGESVTMNIAGYLYQTTGNNEWTNCTVTTLTERTDRDYAVRFGADGTNNCLWIGETNSTWSYPQVIVRDFYGGYSMDVDAYDDNWSISFVTSFDTVDETITDNLPTADWDRIEGKPGNATTSVDGLMSSTDKSKLDGIDLGANNYSLPLGTSTTRGGFKVGYTETGKNYPVELSSEKMYVNVPWTDTDTTYEVADETADGLMSAADFTKLQGVEENANNYVLPTNIITAGTYGSTSNSTKIDTITVDSSGRVTAVATGGTGDITGVNVTGPISGGGTSGTVTIGLTTPTSGDWWNGGAVVVGTDGVMEIGKYIDFHDSDTETSDFSYRMTATNTNMAFSGTITATGYNDSNWNTAYSWGDHDGLYAAASHTHSYLPLSGGTVTGVLTLTGSSGVSRLRIEGTTPTIDLDDSDGDSFYIHVNSNNFYVLADRDGAGNYGNWESPHPLQLEADTNKAFIFGSEVKSAAFTLSTDYATASHTHTNADSSNDGFLSSGDYDKFTTAFGWGDHAAAGYASSTHNHNGTYAYYDHIRSLGTQAFTGTATTAGLISEMESDGAFDSYTSVFKTSWSYAGNFNLSDAGRLTETAGTSWITWTDNSSDSTRGNITALVIAPNTGGSAGKMFVYNDQGSGYSPGWREIWTSRSDGAGSGLDADLLDGNHASAFALSGHSHSDATTSDSGFMSSTDKSKLDGIDSGANNYSLPLGTSTVRGGFKVGYAENGKNYPVELSSEKMYVNVPWTDTDTTYEIADSVTDGLLSSADYDNFTTAFGWGDHASAGYLTSVPSAISVTSVTIGSGVTLSESTDRADLLSIKSGTGGWGGLQVTNNNGDGILSLMIDGSAGGLYDDQNNDWILYYTENGGVQLRHNATSKIETLSTGVVVSGEIRINDSSTVIKEGANNSVNISTGTGSVDIGSMNASWVHIQADRDIYILPSTGGKVAVDGNLTPYSDNAKTLGASGARWSTIYGVTGTFSGDVVAYSDARVKENVETIETPLDKVMKLRGVSFNRTGEDRKNIGVIAQEIREVLPEVVHEQEDGMLAVAYGNIVGLLIEAMKEQQEQIDELKSMLGK